MCLVKTSPTALLRLLSIGSAIASSPRLAVGLVLTKPEGLRQLFGKFSFFCFADTSVYLWRKKSKISSKILAAHARNMCEHTLNHKKPLEYEKSLERNSQKFHIIFI